MDHEQELYEGEPVKIKGRTYIVPGLSFGQLERLVEKIERLSANKKGILTKQHINDVVEVAHAAISRNYPDLKTSDVKEFIDTRNAKRIMDVIMGLSGLEKSVSTGEDAGETSPVA